MTQPVQTLNQFAQQPPKGSVAAVPNPVTISAQVSKDSLNTLYPGDAVRLTGGTTDQIEVDFCSAVSDQVIGFVVRNQKRAYFTAGQPLEIAMEGTVIYLEAYGAIDRGNKVEWYPTGHQVEEAKGSNSTVGTALDIARLTGDIIRVKFTTTDAYSSSCSSSCSSCSSSCSSCSSSSSRSSSCSSCCSSSSCRSSSSSSCLSSSSSSLTV